ncbi:hypothetical protein FNV1923 [Fusobacterium vincentii ATCC 49256]|uniref:Uncharacterized protein n=1 Tax=Fusobacterium vincentii ATCC 49256 TaxID=209882 RepID=Q7P7P9_FUSVC|nr:hypothetical protein FNV1923 [Fusobacterium vincentii ATCC 49256]
MKARFIYLQMKLLRRPLLLSEPLWSSRNTNGWQVVLIYNEKFREIILSRKLFLLKFYKKL